MENKNQAFRSISTLYIMAYLSKTKQVGLYEIKLARCRMMSQTLTAVKNFECLKNQLKNTK